MPIPMPLLPAAAIWLASTAVAGSLESDVTALVRGAKLPGATISVSVRDAADGRELVDLSADRPMIPASNMKLLSTGAALDGLGPEFRFRTRLVHRPGTGGGTLVVIGDGDPAFGDPELLATTMHRRPDGTVVAGLAVEELISLWVDAIESRGIRRLETLVVDDRVFDRAFRPQGWPMDQANEHYCAEVAGLNFHANCLHLAPAPASDRAVPGPFTPDAPWVVIHNRASANRGKKDQHNPWISHEPATPAAPNALALRGNVREPSAVPIRVTLREVPDFFATLLADRLRRRGIEIGSVRVANADDPSFANEIDVAPIISTPITTVLQRANSDSSNLHAECLFKRLAHEQTNAPATWSAAAAALREELAKRVPTPLLEGVEICDGSGLGRGNRIRADLVTAWLASLVADPEIRGPWLASMAVGGEHGTLKRRFSGIDLAGCEVRAKSGYINGVSCLSGYVLAPDGRSFAFSVLCNNVRSVADAKKLQERIAARVARELSTASARS